MINDFSYGGCGKAIAEGKFLHRKAFSVFRPDRFIALFQFFSITGYLSPGSVLLLFCRHIDIAGLDIVLELFHQCFGKKRLCVYVFQMQASFLI